MGAALDITGGRFGRLLAISKAPRSNGNNPRTQWNCRCDCGNEVVVGTMNLVRGRARSCGCAQKQIVTRLNTKHGKSKSSEYKAWRAMTARCTIKSNASYANYGGRGIQVCERWKSFENFYADMGDRPVGMTIDRFPDKNGNYEPGNCRWATREQQDTNKRTNIYVTWNGKTMTYSQWAKELGADPSVLRNRYLKFGTFEPQARHRGGAKG